MLLAFSWFVVHDRVYYLDVLCLNGALQYIIWIKKCRHVCRFCKPIMTKARPAPPKPASPPEAKGSSGKESETTSNGSAAECGDSQPTEPMDSESSHAEGEKMQTD